MRFCFGGLLAVWMGLLGISSVGCAGDNSSPVPAENETVDLAEMGKPLYLTYCAHCHGVQGAGDGFNSEYLEKEPAELADQKFISKKANEQIFRVIDRGGAGVKKSHLMPVFGHTLSEEEIWSLVAYVRNLAADNSHPVRPPGSVQKKRPVMPPLSRESVESFSEWMKTSGKTKETLDRGETLFKKKMSCFACHRIDGEGGRIGPELSRAAFNYSPEWLYAWIANPQEFKPETLMPNMGMDPEDVWAIAAFLTGLPTTDETPQEWTVYLTTKGDPGNGKKLFFDPEGKVHCSKCHQVREKGGNVGPDLSFVGSSRTVAFLLESILNPKAVITSGYDTVLILTKDRKFITGIKKNEDASSLEIVDKEGRTINILKEHIKKFKIQKISTMPGNFKNLLEVQEVADILAYLKTLSLPVLSRKL